MDKDILLALKEASHALPRNRLEDLSLPTGVKAHLYRLLHDKGPGNGTLMVLPIDQGLEHGPRDFFPNPPSKDPEYEFRLADEGRFSAIACHIGLAEKHAQAWAGKVPLILKLNGKTEVPSDARALSPQTAFVEDALRLGADAVGYTLYVGSPAQEDDFVQFAAIREEAHRYGLPVVVWSYPRGEAIAQKGGKDSLYAVDYAARVAAELGADVIKLNLPKVDAHLLQNAPAPYSDLSIKQEEAVAAVVASAGRSLVIFAGGEKGGREATLEKVRLVMEAGATGVIFGRNLWQRPWDEGLALAKDVRTLLKDY